MNKRVLLYLVAIVAVFSLQSCVTNYVVSKPITYNPDAHLAMSVPNNTTKQKKEASPSKKIDIALASIQNTNKAMEIQKAILFEQQMDGVLAEAESYLGTPYRYGGTTRKGIDCSAFVFSVYEASLGLSLPRVAADQAHEGERVERENLQKGDLVFFSRGGRISHVGIVHHIDENGVPHFIHAATSQGVMISPLTDKYWSPKFRFAKRLVNPESPITQPETDNFVQN